MAYVLILVGHFLLAEDVYYAWGLLHYALNNATVLQGLCSNFLQSERKWQINQCTELDIYYRTSRKAN